MVSLDAATGLRVSEQLALRWMDVDFENLEVNVTRSIWHQVVGDCKTEASAKHVPLGGYMAEDLLRWRRQSPYPMAPDYIFASPYTHGKHPYWPDNLMKRYVKPVARAAGIHKNIGWHTFRHSFGTLLKANGEDVKTRSGAFTARQQQDHARHLHAGSDLAEARRSKQGCRDDGFQSGSERRKERPANFGLGNELDPYWTRVWLVTLGAI
ncbi:MAG: tyrosine-type recombinase/integrase [Acidobacteria bacterium]|nr:tyrosine-type recombinase/integrase [Acidobacteriota bacterium]